MKLKGKKIIIFQQRGWGISIGHFLAKKLSDSGCRLSALTLKKTTHIFVKNQKDVEYEMIINNDEIMEDPQKYLGDSQITLKEVCEGLGVDSIWPIVASLRHHVRSYEYKYYYGFRQSVSDEEIVLYVKATYKYIKNFFEDCNPDIIIAPNFVALPHIMFNLYADKVGIPMIGITDTKIRGYYMFTHSYNDDKGPVFDRYRELSDEGVISHSQKKAKEYIKQFREDFIAPQYRREDENNISFLKMLRKELVPYYKCFQYVFNSHVNTLKSTGVTIDSKTPRIILRDHYAHRRNTKFAEQFNYYPLEKVDKFIYFPLQFQPESSIDVLAPYFNNQIEIARLVAQSLPDDYTLVVKEHPAMIGYRSISYIEKLSLTPNIKLVDWRIPGETLLKNSDLVISPNGTSLVEAAFLRKPVIQLGNLGPTLLLPNVFKHSDLTTISQKIKEILQLDFNSTAYDKDLKNYVSAVFDNGFDVDYLAAWERSVDVPLLWNLYRSEIERLV